LLVLWENVLTEDGSARLTYKTDSKTWTSQCTAGLKYEVLRDGSELELRVRYWVSGACGGVGDSLECSNRRPSPFRLKETAAQRGAIATFVPGPSSCPGLAASGYTRFTVSTATERH
jgi:hypothetical protein